MTAHEDDRRKIIDWSDHLPIMSCKIVKALEDCELGNHHHLEKTERFMLVAGEGTVQLNKGNWIDLEIDKVLTVVPGIDHTFKLKKGSILLCLVDKSYSESDDYQS